MNWHYSSENLTGNVHVATGWINEHHPEWDIVAMEFNGGGYTTVVHRYPQPDTPTKRWTEVLCQTCGGNGVIQMANGVSECSRCKGSCYDPCQV